MTAKQRPLQITELPWRALLKEALHGPLGEITVTQHPHRKHAEAFAVDVQTGWKDDKPQFEQKLVNWIPLSIPWGRTRDVIVAELQQRLLDFVERQAGPAARWKDEWVKNLCLVVAAEAHTTGPTLTTFMGFVRTGGANAEAD